VFPSFPLPLPPSLSIQKYWTIKNCNASMKDNYRSLFMKNQYSLCITWGIDYRDITKDIYQTVRIPYCPKTMWWIFASMQHMWILGEWPCVATEIYNIMITYVKMCVILLWEKVYGHLVLVGLGDGDIVGVGTWLAWATATSLVWQRVRSRP
jgi:hypothetical protein